MARLLPDTPGWSLPEWVAAVLAIGPGDLGGVFVRGPSGPESDGWRLLARELVPRWRSVGPSLDPEHLAGAMDLARTLETGRVHYFEGLLTQVGDGVLEVRWPSLLDTAAADALSAVAGRVGLVAFQPISFGHGDEDPVEPLLVDRMAVWLTLPPRWAGHADVPSIAHRVREGADRLPQVTSPREMTLRLIAAADAWGVGEARTLASALRVARRVCALHLRTSVTEADVALALAMVVAPRGAPVEARWDEERAQPEEPPESSDEERESAPPSPEPAVDAGAEDPDDIERPDASDIDRMVDAAETWIPPELLARARANGSATRSGKGGSRNATARSAGVTGRGRTLRSRPGTPGRGRRLHVIETLRAAAPMQTVRGRTAGARLAVRAEDLRIRVTERRDPTTVVFAVDASGSQAVARLGEVKGAVELLLAESYRRRDHVALVAFRGAGADLALAPTRSLTRARRATTGLAGGGGTPLAHGLVLAGQVAAGEARVGRRPMIVVLTDGRPNVAMGEGRSGREHAREDALRVARTIAANGWPVLVVDSARRPEAFTEELALALDGDVVRLRARDSRALTEAISAGLTEASVRRSGA